MSDITTSGDKREQIVKLITNHLFEMDYEFTLIHDEDITRFDLGNYGSVLIAKNAYQLEAHVRPRDTK